MNADYLDRLQDLGTTASDAPWVGIGGGRKLGVLGRAVNRGTGNAIAVFSGTPATKRGPDAKFCAAARNVWDEMVAVIDAAVPGHRAPDSTCPLCAALDALKAKVESL